MTPANTFDIVDHRDPSQARRYRETFDEAYYDLADDGNINLVLRRRAPVEKGAKAELTQVIHIRSFWRSVPGQTVAERTQINSCVSYMIVSGEAGATFEGAGSVFFEHDWYGSALSGTLDHAMLKPQRRLATGSEVFARAELSGNFHAERDARQVARLVNEMNRMFGPLPAYQPPTTSESPRTSGRSSPR